MLDIKYIKENKEKVKKAVNDKQMSNSVDIDLLLGTYDTYLELLKQVEIHRNLKNNLSKDISKLTEGDRSKILLEAKDVKSELTKLETELTAISEKLNTLQLAVPNIYAEDVPYGVDESENVVARKVGEPKVFDFTPKEHMDIGEALGIIDVETAGKVSGSRFCYLLNEAVLLQFALVQFCLKTVTDPVVIADLAKKAGSPSAKTFIPVVPPVIVKPEVMKRMDRLDPIEERYYIPSDDVLLVGSAEHTLGPMLADSTIEYAKLPIRYIGYSTAFRREAGSYGKDVKGILRVHQFDKLEMESFAAQEQGESEQRLFVAIQEYLVQQLGIPYQVVNVCTGDMGKPDYRHIDIECWLPGQGKYRETHTSDYMTDYQSRRLNAGYRDKNGDRKLMYMNDATAIAIGRTLIAILENYQQKDGSVVIPGVLRPFMGIEIIEPKKS
ncbi:serine--tRNA ligase [candidate division WWE3 bacterium]|uniref:Serine--tRNA ligase n=1 Tax=candidate division WWE3 bacterium TaxID=2053526 RepID=A0A7X9DK57_UNCKA|nr:serine--tRNA ligase [candidate division WWE3 bacterium]